MARYIVTLDPAIHANETEAEAAIASAGATLLKSFNFNQTFLIEASNEQKSAIVGLASSELADSPLQVSLQVLNIDHLKLTLLSDDGELVPATYNPMNRGAGQHIYLVDTGVRATHEQFTGVSINNLYSNFTGNDAYDEFGDTTGHGTIVASVIVGKDLGPAKDATLHNVKLFNSGSDTSTVVEIVDALDAVLQHHLANSPSQAKVVCMPWIATRNAFIDSKVLEMNSSNLVVVAAAGNNGADVSDYSPAGIRQIITVGAFDSQFAVGPFVNMPWDNTNAVTTYNNYGAEIDIFAMGVNVYTASGTSDTAYLDTATGTSVSSGITAGVAAQYIARYPSYNSAKIKDVMLQEGHLLGMDLLAFNQVPAGVDYTTVNKSIVVFDELNEEMLTTLPSGRIATLAVGQTTTVNLGLNSSATEVSALDFAPLPPFATFDTATGIVSINTSTVDSSVVPGSFVFAIKGKINGVTKVEEFSIAVYNTSETEIEGSSQYYYDADSNAYDPVVSFQVAPGNVAKN